MRLLPASGFCFKIINIYNTLLFHPIGKTEGSQGRFSCRDRGIFWKIRRRNGRNPDSPIAWLCHTRARAMRNRYRASTPFFMRLFELRDVQCDWGESHREPDPWNRNCISFENHARSFEHSLSFFHTLRIHH